MMRHVERLVRALLVLLAGSTWWGSAEAQSAPVPLPKGVTAAIVAQGKVWRVTAWMAKAASGRT